MPPGRKGAGSGVSHKKREPAEAPPAALAAGADAAGLAAANLPAPGSTDLQPEDPAISREHLAASGLDHDQVGGLTRDRPRLSRRWRGLAAAETQRRRQHGEDGGGGGGGGRGGGGRGR